jgi:hypothetical protein
MPLVVKQRPPKAELRWQTRRKLVAQELKPVAKAMEKSRAKIVADWDHKPQFQAQITVKPDRIEIDVVVRRGTRLPSSDATTSDLWKWLDQTGTKAHPIPKQPKTNGYLVFPWGGPGSYQPKTSPNPARYGGPGRVVNAQTVYRKQVQHPGFKPRHFSDEIDPDIEKDFYNAIERARRKAQKAGY